MENVTDALYLAFAVMILVIALSMSMDTFSQARQTSDIIIGTVEAASNLDFEEIDTTSLSYREVGLETIIPSLYRYYKENLTIVFLQGNPVTTVTDGVTHITGVTDVQPLPIYKSMTPNTDWDSSYKGDFGASPVVYPSYGYKLNNTTYGEICVFDVEEENARREPFVIDRKKNIDELLAGRSKLTTPQATKYWYNGEKWYDYSSSSNNPLLDRGKKYLELVSRESKDALGGNKTTRKTIITYIRLN